MLALINLLEKFQKERVDFITYETTCRMLKIGPLAAKGRMTLRQIIISCCFENRSVPSAVRIFLDKKVVS